jgi:hypothetical protein
MRWIFWMTLLNPHTILRMKEMCVQWFIEEETEVQEGKGSDKHQI